MAALLQPVSPANAVGHAVNAGDEPKLDFRHLEFLDGDDDGQYSQLNHADAS